MKKMLCIFITAALCLSFAACGGKSEPQQSQQTENSAQAASRTLNRSIYDETSGCYTNSYTQLTVNVPGDWYIYADSDLAAAYLEGRVTGDELSMWSTADFENKAVIPDFAFQDMANGNNISVVYINCSKTEQEITDETAFLNLVAQTKAQQGYAGDMEYGKITLSGNEYTLMEISNDTAAVYMAAREKDGYIIAVTATDKTGAGKEMFFGFIE